MNDEIWKKVIPHFPSVTGSLQERVVKLDEFHVRKLISMLTFKAKTLEQVEAIYWAHFKEIIGVSGFVACCIANKIHKGTEYPLLSIRVFVAHKGGYSTKKVPMVLQDKATGMWCITDVVQGARKESCDDDDPRVLGTEKSKEVARMHKQDVFQGGLPLYTDSGHGTIACIVKAQDKYHVLTNNHVVENATMYGTSVGKLQPMINKFGESKVDASTYFTSSLQGIQYTIDCALVELGEKENWKYGVHNMPDLKQSLLRVSNNCASMNFPVSSVGARQGTQKGTLVGRYLYTRNTLYDYLIVSNSEDIHFAIFGDSGKLLCYDNSPFALLCGGSCDTLIETHNPMLSYSFAIDLRNVHKQLGIQEWYLKESTCTLI